VVAYWPSVAPEIPSEDPIGKHAQRRITDAASSDDPLTALRERATGYRPGDTDLTWTRLTPWRTVLAALFDQSVEAVHGVKVTAETDNPSAHLLTTWLHMHLNVPVELIEGTAPGISRVSFDMSDGQLAIERQSETGHSLLIRPDAPVSTVNVPRRHLDELLSEELRRLDPDEEYGRVLHAFGSHHG
jgi:glucose-6-phosphate dehydrogenase assembly protein OpcA